MSKVTLAQYRKLLPPKICAHCGDEFLLHHRMAEYCSHSCRQMAFKKRKKKRARP